MWKTVLETEDVLIYEKTLAKLLVRIEARKENEGPWILYKKYSTHNNTINYTEDFTCKSMEEAKELVTCLQNSKIKTVQEITELKLTQNKDIKIEIKRNFRDYNCEGWMFNVNDGEFCNKVFVREKDYIEADVILNDLYRPLEGKIVHKLVDVLGISDELTKTKIVVHYCNSKVKYFVEEGYLEETQKV